MKTSAILCATVLIITLLLLSENSVATSNQPGAESPTSHLSTVGDPPVAPQGKTLIKKRTRSQVLFDDFNYSTHKELLSHGWIIRTAAGWPGVPGATWRKEGVSFVRDPEHPGNRALRMISATDGNGPNTTQTQICHERKYLEGTYAARVRFVDDPMSGPSGDQLVESFYTISPLKAPMDPDYSELDFEYLPHGGWGVSGPTLYSTTWETFSPEPNWKKDNIFQLSNGSQAGWHGLANQVADGKGQYCVDVK